MRAILRLCAATAVLLFVITGAALGETKWLCAFNEAVESSEGGLSGPADFGGVTPPSFAYVDLEKKLITLLAPASRRGETTVINSMLETKEGWILSGVEAERAWSVILTNEGSLTVSITMDGTTRSVFGRCMPASLAKP